METEGSLSCSQEPATSPRPEADKSNPQGYKAEGTGSTPYF
jgi:hypothetical protein